MFDIITEKDIKMYLTASGEKYSSYRTNKFIFALVGTLLGVAFALLSGKIYLYGVALALGLCGYKLPYILIKSSKKQQDIMNLQIFPLFLQRFLAIIPTTNNVYATLKLANKEIPEPLHTEVNKLVDLIEYDNRREYYLDFAKFIGSTEAFTVMDMIYKFSEFGIDDEQLRRITEFINRIQENQIEETITSKLNKMENVGLMPLFISMILVGGYTVTMFIHYFSQGVI